MQCAVTRAAGKTKKMDKSYSELMLIDDYIERYRYLRTLSAVGDPTFGSKRYLNQILYTSDEWKSFRREIIIRDSGCDMATPGFKIFGMIIVHHINPITIEDILQRRPCVFDPDNVVTVSELTHKAIHYGNEQMLIMIPTMRSQNDTCPWK